MATVGLAPTRSNIFRRRQKATRMPYSCQLQLGRSGSCGAPCGGVMTVRAMGRERSQSSSENTGHTTRRMPSGRRNGGRPSMGEKVMRSRGCIGLRRLERLEEASAAAKVDELFPRQLTVTQDPAQQANT